MDSSQQTALSICNLSKSFGRKKIIDNISFDVNYGEVFGFLGPNGAGKTTTIKTVMGFLFPDEGRIVINGIDTKKDYEGAMSSIGGIVENPEMYKDLSGLTNLLMYARIHGNIPRSRIDEVVELVGMTDRINDKVKKYSLGMKQRIGVAQALVHSPRVLILDEPTNGLDPVGIRELRDILKRLAHEQNVAVIVSSHQLSEMQLMCDRVGIIAKGKILGVKPIDELLSLEAGGESYRFEVGDTEAAMKVLSDMGMSEKATKEEKAVVLTVTKDDIPSVTSALSSAGIAVFGITRVESSLEDAFIDITGGGMKIE